MLFSYTPAYFPTTPPLFSYTPHLFSHPPQNGKWGLTTNSSRLQLHNDNSEELYHAAISSLIAEERAWKSRKPLWDLVLRDPKMRRMPAEILNHMHGFFQQQQQL